MDTASVFTYLKAETHFQNHFSYWYQSVMFTYWSLIWISLVKLWRPIGNKYSETISRAWISSLQCTMTLFMFTARLVPSRSRFIDLDSNLKLIFQQSSGQPYPNLYTDFCYYIHGVWQFSWKQRHNEYHQTVTVCM